MRSRSACSCALENTHPKRNVQAHTGEFAPTDAFAPAPPPPRSRSLLHARTRSLAHRHTRASARIRTNACAGNAGTRVDAGAQKNSRVRARTLCVRTHTRKHARTHTRKHARAHTRARARAHAVAQKRARAARGAAQKHKGKLTPSRERFDMDATGCSLFNLDARTTSHGSSSLRRVPWCDLEWDGASNACVPASALIQDRREFCRAHVLNQTCLVRATRFCKTTQLSPV
eukprot:3031378-Pleurochrysis_carterae.AAC.1